MGNAGSTSDRSGIPSLITRFEGGFAWPNYFPVSTLLQMWLPMDKVGCWLDSVPNSDSSQTTVVIVILSVTEGCTRPYVVSR